MVELVGIESNIAESAQLISRTSGHPNPVKTTSDQKMSDWNHTWGHLLCPSQTLSPSTHLVVYDNEEVIFIL